MAIDIDQLSEAELIDLHHRIVARLQLLQQLEAHASMLEFRIGERMKFQPEGRAPVSGVIMRYNCPDGKRTAVECGTAALAKGRIEETRGLVRAWPDHFAASRAAAAALVARRTSA